jgi:ABC-type Fe3+ transport system substrate-binding protein
VRPTERLLVILGVAMMVFGGGGDVRADDHELVVVSSHWEGIKREFERGFNQTRLSQGEPPIKFRWLDIGGTSDILRYVRSEYARSPDSIGVDLFFGGGSDPYVELASAGLLHPCPVPDEVLAGIPADLRGVSLRDPSGRWFAASLSSFGILINRRVVSVMGLPEPKTWRDVAVPAARSWVSFAEPRKSGTAHAMVEIILQAYGWDEGWRILRNIGRNVRSFASASSQIPKEVAVGEAAYGFLLDSYGRDAVKKFGAENVRFVTPTDYVPYSGDAIAIFRGAPHRELAEQFVSFVLSDVGQRLFLAKKGVSGGPATFELGKLSVRPRLYEILDNDAAVGDRPFATTSSFRYDTALASRRYEVVNDLVGACVIDADLSQRKEGDGVTEQPPITEQGALDLATNWKDPSVRQRHIAQWRKRCLGSAASERGWLSAFGVLVLLLIGRGGVVRWRRYQPGRSQQGWR